MSSAPTPRRGNAPILYSLVAVAVAFELGVTWLALHPAVGPDYRAYYIDLSTTCLNKPMAGTYALGDQLSFLPPGHAAARKVRVCGWDGPAGDGTHSVGTTSRLHFAVPAAKGSSFTLSQVVFRNVASENDAALNELAAAYIGKTVTLSDLTFWR